MAGTRREELLAELENSLGEHVYSNLRALERSYQTYKTNYGELMEACDDIEAIEATDSFDSAKHQDAVLELCVRFHNFVVTTKTIYETSATVRNQHFDEEMEDAYQSKVDSVDLHPARGQFMKCLRNYTQHRHIPPVQTRASRSVLDKMTGGRPDVTVFIDRARLVESGELNDIAERYVGQMDGNEIDIREEAENYYEETVEIQSWMTEYYMEQFEDALDRRDNIIQELRET